MTRDAQVPLIPAPRPSPDRERSVEDVLCAVSRGVDAVICWSLAPQWCRGSLWGAVHRAVNRDPNQTEIRTVGGDWDGKAGQQDHRAENSGRSPERGTSGGPGAERHRLAR